MNKVKLSNLIEEKRIEINSLFETYYDVINDEGIKTHLKKIKNRLEEYQNKSFIILVIGPVKSGKSTLVNQIAHADVSPTDFLECTIRPSIISCNYVQDSPNTITSYISELPERSVEQFDLILDYLRGQEKLENISHIKCESCDLKPENIIRKIKLHHSDIANDNVLATSITTPGGKLLQKDVFLIDMPGFDGAVTNLENNPIYKVIAERADLIIFVQSSNSAISKVANDFLQILKENNKDVPVCLIHNVFEAAYWKPDDEKEKITNEQKEYAYKVIREKGFLIEKEYCYSINLGKVNDSNKGYADKTLLKEKDKFEIIENDLYKKIIESREDMQLRNCLNRTKQQYNKLFDFLLKRINEMDNLCDQYKNIENEFNKIKDENILIYNETELAISFPINSIGVKLNQLITTILNGINNNIQFKTTDARNIVNKFLDDCNTKIRESISGDSAYRPLFSLIQSKENERINQIKSKVLDFNCKSKPFIGIDQTEFIKNIPIDITNIVNIKHLVPKLKWRKRNSKDMISTYLYQIRDILMGYIDPSGNIIPSHIETTIIPPIQELIKQDYKEGIKKSADYCANYWITSMQNVLKTIIANKEMFDKEYETIKNLKNKLSNITIQ